eukprot:scaffold9522_cov195-Skeletonema_dohrnii-CCMP3373.AAC.6
MNLSTECMGYDLSTRLLLVDRARAYCLLLLELLTIVADSQQGRRNAACEREEMKATAKK